MRAITKYLCEFCGTEHQEEADAIACEARGFPTTVMVGDIVTCYKCYSWYNGDPVWISNFEKIRDLWAVTGSRPVCHNDHGNCFGDCCNFLFYYVVTNIGSYYDVASSYGLAEKHNPIYHVASLAMKCADEGDVQQSRSGNRSLQLGDPLLTGWTTADYHFTPFKVENPPAAVVQQSRRLIGLSFRHLL
jgi:hypothetical protein